jgi:hypothetical protein
MRPIVPLTGANVRGPLGVAHLPRLWLKCVLAAGGLLDSVYRTGYDGTNQVLLDGIGLDPYATFAELRTQPAYLPFEAWVRAHATRLDETTTARTNELIATQQKPLDNAAAVRARVGVRDASIGGAALLNDLDDWHAVYAAVLAGTSDALVPAISSQTSGPAGIKHAPRFWLKATLKAHGLLYPGWKSGPESGFDMFFIASLGFDFERAHAYIAGDAPFYLAFERWLLDNAAHVDSASIERHNAAVDARLKPEEVAAVERATLGIDDPSYRLSVALNDLIDWRELHALSVPAAPSSNPA